MLHLATEGTMKTAASLAHVHHPKSHRLDAKAVAGLYGLSIKSLADILHVPAANLRSNGRHSPGIQQPLSQLVNAYDGLAEIFPEGHVAKWLHHPNRALKQTPLAYLQEHGPASFGAMVDTLLSGGYA